MSTYETYKKRLQDKNRLDKENNAVDKQEFQNNNDTSFNDLNLAEKVGAGYQRLRNRVAQGFIDLGEGVVDFHVGTASQIFNVFGNAEAEKQLNDFIKKDFTSQIVNSDAFSKGANLLDFGWITGKEARQVAQSDEKFLPDIVENVGVGVGNALGSTALSSVPYAGKALTFMGYAGGGLEEALNEGGNIHQSMLYGAGTGAVEMATEKVLGGFLEKIGLGTGKMFGIKGGSKGSSNFVTAMLKNANEEGLEEVVSEIVNPILQMVTYKQDAEGNNFFEKYATLFEENGGAEAVLESYLTGALTGGVFEGVGTASGLARYGSMQAYNIELEAQEIASINEEIKEAVAKGDENKVKALEAKKANYLAKIETKFNRFLEQVQADSEARKAQGRETMTKRELNRQALGVKTALEAGKTTTDIKLELAKELTGDYIGVSTTLSKESEANITDAQIKLAEGQISTKEFAKTLAHEMLHIANGNNTNLVNKILNGMTEEEYNKKWKWAEERYKNEAMESQMLKKHMAKNPTLTKEEAYEQIKKDYFEEEMAAEFFGEMFENADDFIKSLKGVNRKGLNALKEKIRLFFRGKTKPKNFTEVMKAFDKGIEKANLEAKKKAETKKASEEKNVKKRITEDSEGDVLTKSQQEFFKDTKFVDSEGNLLRLYHGTGSGGFMEFYESDNGIFLTPNFENAMGYAYSDNLVVTQKFNTMKELMNYIYESGEFGTDIDILKGNEKQALEDINRLKNLYKEKISAEIKTNDRIAILLNNKLEMLKNVEKNGYVGYIDGAPEFYYESEEEALDRFLPDYQSFISDENFSIVENGRLDPEENPANNIYALYANCKNPLVINCRGNSFMSVPFRNTTMVTDEIAEIIKKEGKHDGIIFKNIRDTGGRWQEEFIDDVYVVFKPNQLKAIDNQNPTENSDIRKRVSEDDKKDIIDTDIQEDTSRKSTKARDNLALRMAEYQLEKKPVLAYTTYLGDKQIFTDGFVMLSLVKEDYLPIKDYKNAKTNLSYPNVERFFVESNYSKKTYTLEYSDIKAKIVEAKANNEKSSKVGFSNGYHMYLEIGDRTYLFDSKLFENALTLLNIKSGTIQVKVNENVNTPILVVKNNGSKMIVLPFRQDLRTEAEKADDLREKQDAEAQVQEQKKLEEKKNNLRERLAKIDDHITENEHDKLSKSIEEMTLIDYGRIDDMLKSLTAKVEKQKKLEKARKDAVDNVSKEIANLEKRVDSLNDNVSYSIYNKEKAKDKLNDLQDALKDANTSGERINKLYDDLITMLNGLENAQQTPTTNKDFKQELLDKLNAIEGAKEADGYSELVEKINKAQPKDRLALYKEIKSFNPNALSSKPGIIEIKVEPKEETTPQVKEEVKVETETPKVEETKTEARIEKEKADEEEKRVKQLVVDYGKTKKENHKTLMVKREAIYKNASRFMEEDFEINDSNYETANRYLNEITDLIAEARKYGQNFFKYLRDNNVEENNSNELAKQHSLDLISWKSRPSNETISIRTYISKLKKNINKYLATKTELEQQAHNVAGYIYTVRKNPVVSADTINYYADVFGDVKYAQARVNDLINLVKEKIQKIYGAKKLKIKFEFAENKEFAINKIHMILNKFSNAEHVKKGENAYNFKNLTTEQQVELITKEILSGMQVYIETETKSGYYNVSELEGDKIYTKFKENIETQVKTILEKGGEPTKLVKEINKATENAQKEIENLNVKVSGLTAQIISDNEIIKDLELEIEALQDKLDSDNSEETIKDLQKQLKKAENKLEQVIVNSNKRLEKAKARNIEYKTLTKIAEDNAKAAIKELEKATKKLNKAEEKLGLAQTKINELKATQKELTSELKAKEAVNKKLEKINKKYTDEIIYQKSQLKRGQALTPRFVEALTTLGKEINPDFEISNENSIKLAELLIDNNTEEAFNLYLNIILDSDFTTDDGIVPYSEIVDMLNVDNSSEYHQAVQSLKDTFENTLKTGRFTITEKLYRQIERMSFKYMLEHSKYLGKKAELALVRASNSTILTQKRTQKQFKKLKSNKKFGGINTELVDFFQKFYDTLGGLSLKQIQNLEFTTKLNELFTEYDNLEHTLKEYDLRMPDDLKQSFQNLKDGVDNNGKALTEKGRIMLYKKILNQMSRYIKAVTGTTTFTIDGVTKTRAEWAEEMYKEVTYLKEKGIIWGNFTDKLLKSLDPRVVFKFMGGMNENSIMYKLYKKLNEGEIKYMEAWLDLSADIEEFDRKHKKWIKKNLSDNKRAPKVTINDITATNAQFLSLYKTIKREQGKKHLMNSAGGFVIEGSNDIVRGLSEEQINSLIDAIEKHYKLNDESSLFKQYLDLSTKFFEKAKEYKKTTDMEFMGYTNIEDGEYFPIRCTDIDGYLQLGKDAFEIGGSKVVGVFDMSINKDVTGSNRAVKISSIQNVIQTHRKQIATYYGYANAINTVNKLFNYRFKTDSDFLSNNINSVGGLFNTGNTNSFNNWLDELFKDMQGLSRGKSDFLNKHFGRLRGRYATAVLGLNPRVVLTQVSALGNALKYVKGTALARAIGSNINIKSGEYKLPALGRYRNKSNQITHAETLSDVSNKMTLFIEKADQLYINIIWKACLIQNGFNVEKATKMFNKTVQETQPNYTPLQRSSLMRNDNEIVRSLLMFQNQSNKNWSNAFEGFLTIYAKKKLGLEITAEDRKLMINSWKSIMVGSAMFAIISQLMAHIIDRDWDDDLEDWIREYCEKLLNDSIIGMIPIFNNVINVDLEKKFKLKFQLYDLELDNTIGTINQLIDIMENALNGKVAPREWATALGNLTGMPIDNAYKFFIKAPLNYIAPETAVEIDAKYNGKSITTTQSVRNAKTHKTKYYYSVYSKNTIATIDDDTIAELYRLYKTDKDVILKAIPNSITYDGEDFKVDKAKFAKTYSRVATTLKQIINSSAYKKLSDTEKARLIKLVMSKYHTMSKKQFTEQELNAFDIVTNSDYKYISRDFIYLAHISTLDDKQAKLNYINKLPISATEKYLLYYLAGYSLTDDKQKRVISFLKNNSTLIDTSYLFD